MNWWLRSAASAEQFRNVNTNGNVNSNNASNRNSPRPALAETEDPNGPEARERRPSLKTRCYMTPTLAQIERAWKIVRRGKTQYERYQKYEYYLEDNLLAVQELMETDWLRPGRMSLKRITVPKPRVVQVPTVRDKLVMHILCDGSIYDAVAAQLGDGISACMIGRGTEYGTNRARALLKDYWREYHGVPYVLKGDVHAYFASVDRDRLAEIAGEVIEDEDVLRISRRYIYHDDEKKGMPLGLQQNQCYGNLYLADLDRMIVEELGYRRYGRHMDDFYVIAKTREELEKLLAGIIMKLGELGLELNPKTTVERGRLDFLGFTHLLTDDGKHVLRLQNGKKKAKKRELKMVVRELQAGNLAVEKVQQRYEGWRQRALRAGCRNVVFEMDRHFTLLLHKAGYKTRTTKKGVEILAETN